MKTKDLIKMLQEEDPSGEKEVVTDHGDIYTSMTVPAYWDGILQTLIRDDSKKPYYNIIGVKFHTQGQKILLKSLNFEDILWSGHGTNECLIEYDSEHTKTKTKEYIQKEKQEYQDFLNKEIKRNKQ